MPLKDKFAKIKRELSFCICSNLVRTIKAAHQGNAGREIKIGTVEFSTFSYLFFYRGNKALTDRYAKLLYVSLLIELQHVPCNICTLHDQN